MKDNRNFKQVVNTIKDSEKDVDKVLKAARLQRNETGRMSDERFNKVLELIKEILFGAAAFTVILVVLLIYFYIMSH